MNEKTKEIVFRIGALVVLLSSVLYFAFDPLYAAYGMAVGSAAVAVVRLSSRYTGKNLRIKRLNRMQLYSAFLMVAASAFMFNQRNEWIVCLLCAAVFEVYAAFVMPAHDQE